MDWPIDPDELGRLRFERGVHLFERMYDSDSKAILSRLAALGHGNAHYYLALLARRDLSEVSPRAAMEIFERCSEGRSCKDLRATLELSICYGRGIGCEKDLSKAFQLALDAASSGLTRAAAVVARCALSGIGCTKDLSLARRFLEIAAPDKVPELECALARSTYLGEGGEIDRSWGVRLYQSAAIGGSETACIALASIARSQGREAEAIEWIGRAGDIVPNREVEGGVPGQPK